MNRQEPSPSGATTPLEEARRGVDKFDLDAVKPTFDRLIQILKALFDTPMAALIGFDDDHVWRSGDLPDRFAAGDPLSALIVQDRAPVWFEDLRDDPRSAGHPYVTAEAGLRFYAGAPIQLADGRLLGALSVAGLEPRAYDPELAQALTNLAELAAQECERREALTALARNQASSQRSEQRLKLAAEMAGLHIYEMDFVRGAVRTHGDWTTFFDSPPDFEMLRDRPLDTIDPRDHAAVMAAWERHLANGTPHRTEYRVRRTDGREVWASAAMELFNDAEGNPQRVVGVLRNITDRKIIEANLLQALDAAESASQAKSAFLANMSHELRTPLNGVMGVASALATTRLTARQREMVGIIESSSQTLEALLSDVLDLAKIESGHLELKSEPFDFALAARTCATLFAPAAKAKGLDFQVEIDPRAEGLFEGDAARVRQILSNLLSNAVKFTSAGAVRLAVSAEPARGGALFQASVSDSGIGFDAETKDRLFNRFEQADGSITRRFGGTGLGLAISRSLAEAMGGELDADATPGHGARFTLSIPLRPSARHQTPADPSAPLASANDVILQRAARVLVAEDHPTNRRVVELILSAAGVDLTCVENGEEAVAAAAREDFDLVLMDMQMPVMDGLTAIRLIREREAREGRTRTPIYSLTANAMAEHGQSSLDAGADGHITKPINASALLATVSAACGRVGEADVSPPRRNAG